MVMFEKRMEGFWRIHESQGHRLRNESGNTTLHFATTYDTKFMNTWFEKKESNLITFKSGTNIIQIDIINTDHPHRWKDEIGSLKMVWSSVDESN